MFIAPRYVVCMYVAIGLRSNRVYLVTRQMDIIIFPM